MCKKQSYDFFFNFANAEKSAAEFNLFPAVRKPPSEQDTSAVRTKKIPPTGEVGGKVCWLL